MEHPGFFERAGPFTLTDITRQTGAELTDPDQGAREVADIAHEAFDSVRIKSIRYIGPRKIRVAVKVTRFAPRTKRTVVVFDRVTQKRDKLPRSLKVR